MVGFLSSFIDKVMQSQNVPIVDTAQELPPQLLLLSGIHRTLNTTRQ